jgi:hypothetical protein
MEETCADFRDIGDAVPGHAAVAPGSGPFRSTYALNRIDICCRRARASLAAASVEA